MKLAQLHDWSIMFSICTRCGETEIDRMEGRGTKFCSAPENAVSLDYRRMRREFLRWVPRVLDKLGLPT